MLTAHLRSLTHDELAALPRGEVFRTIVVSEHDVDRTYVAVRGHGFDDWAVYTMESDYLHDPDLVARRGAKLLRERLIRWVVPCDDDTFNVYRS